MSTQRLLKLNEALNLCRVKRTAFLERVKDSRLPSGINIGGSSVVYPENEIAAVLSARALGYNDDQIRDLVLKLETRRKASACELLRSMDLEA